MWHQPERFEKSWPPFCQIWIIFTHLKLWIASARHNFKWVKIQIEYNLAVKGLMLKINIYSIIRPTSDVRHTYCTNWRLNNITWQNQPIPSRPARFVWQPAEGIDPTLIFLGQTAPRNPYNNNNQNRSSRTPRPGISLFKCALDKNRLLIFRKHNCAGLPNGPESYMSRILGKNQGDKLKYILHT